MSTKVTCSRCGEKVNIKRIKIFDEQKNICVCRDCVREQARKKGWVYRNYPLVLGILFLIGGFGSIGRGDAALFRFTFDEKTTAVICIVLGVAMLALYVYQVLSKKKRN